jgi:hypothetical protein
MKLTINMNPGILAPSPKRPGEGDSSTFHFLEMMSNTEI